MDKKNQKRGECMPVLAMGYGFENCKPWWRLDLLIKWLCLKGQWSSNKPLFWVIDDIWQWFVEKVLKVEVCTN
jgi:hypothetical protein